MRATRGRPETAALLRSFVWALVITCSLIVLPGTATAAVTATELTTAGNDTDGLSYATASITPAANTLILAWVTNSIGTTPPGTPTLAGNGLTWVQVATVTWGPIANSLYRTTLFRAMGASPTSGVITITFAAAQTGCAWSVIQFGGVDASGTNGSGAVVQFNTGRLDNAGITGLSITLAALADASNATAGGFSNAVNNVNSISAGTGYTAFTGATYASPNTSQKAEWRATGSTTVNVTQSQSSHIAGIAVEIKNATFNYRRPITISDAMTPTANCPGSASLASFPVLVSFTDNTLRTVANGGNVRSTTGYDIIFRALDSAICTDSGNPAPCTLDHEIEKYDGVNGQVIAWVRIPTLVYNAATTVYIYYGNGTIGAPTENPTGVWNTNFKGVWHLKEDAAGTGTIDLYKDSTANGNHGADYASATGKAGKIGSGQEFNGINDYINCGNKSNLDVPYITMEFWLNVTSWVSDGGVLAKGDNTYRQYWLWNYSNGVSFEIDEGTLQNNAWNPPAGQWEHLVLTYDGSNVITYRNGAQENSYPQTTDTINATTQPLLFGYIPSYSYFNGYLDEIRISDVARDACWIATEYNNQGAPATYVTVGAETPDAPTLAELTSFSATKRGDAVLLKWRTGFEVDNLGFHVYREVGGERVRVTPSLIAGSALFAGVGTPLTAGQSYAWWDSSPVAGASYWLEEWELSGERRWHGPVTVQPGPVQAQAQGLVVPASGGSVPASSPLLAGFGQSVSPSPPHGVRRKLRQSLVSAEERRAVQWGLASRPAVKLLVSEEGWYRVTQEELAAAGLDREVDPTKLQLFTEGMRVPILVDGEADGRLGSGDAIAFYGLGLDTPSTGVRVYWLAVEDGPGTRIPEDSGGGSWSPGPASFPYEVERADRTVYVPALLNGDAENFFGAVVTTTPVSQTVRLRHVDRSTEAVVTVRLQGLTQGAHRVGVELNGVRVGTLAWEGMTAGELAVPVGGRMVWEGDNLIALAAEGGEGDVSAVDFVRVRYPHTWDADGEGLKFSLGGYQEVTIGGFASSQVRVLDVTDPWAVQALPADVAKDGSAYRVTVGVPEPGARTLLAVGTGAVRHPVGVLPNRPSAWHAAGEGADLLVIGQGWMLQAVEPLRALRERQGLKVALVDVENVCDEFSFGARSPQAIKDFLACARDRWSRPPRYLLLVGDASYDPRNYLGYGFLDLLPTRLVDTKYLETASDDWFADFDGDGIGDIPVGRLPVQTAWEAATVVGKIVAYEGSAKLGRVLLVADANDKDNDFEGLSAQVRAALPATVWVAEVFRGQLGDGPAKGLLARQLNLGQTLVNYVGHGSVAVWHGNLLTTEEARALRNYWFPFVASMTCLNGFFQDPQAESMAEALLEAPGGAVAVWASSGLTESEAQLPIDEALVRLLYSGTSITLGDATRAAKAAASDMDVRRTWILFGDPTTRLK